RAGSKLGALDAVAKQYPEAKIERFTGTLSSRESAEKALDGVDVVYHLAASLSGAPADIFLNTVVASKNLLEAMVKTGRRMKIVLVSSFGVYGVADLPRGHVVDENTPLEGTLRFAISTRRPSSGRRSSSGSITRNTASRSRCSGRASSMVRADRPSRRG